MTANWQQYSLVLTKSQITLLLSELKLSVYFDSGDATTGKYNILSAEPVEINSETSEFSQQVIPDEYCDLPFVCGEIGFTSYDWGESKLIECDSRKPNIELPKRFSGYYCWSYVFDHHRSEGKLTFSPICPINLRNKILSLVNYLAPSIYIEGAKFANAPKQIGKTRETKAEKALWQTNQSYSTYVEQFNQVKEYIFSGDCYQVNLAQRFEASLQGDITKFYFRTREKTNTHFACYMSLGEEQTLLSFSPEQFISIKNRKVSTRPIKGTIENKDNLSPEELEKSDKNRAENLMIVDLLRNALSKVCKTHSVITEELFKLETYKNVHHLVSTISGELEDDISEKEAYLECFPGGSITGAPKKRAMEIINELEIHSRSAYCGSIYYLNDNGNFDSNILIRTIVHSGDKLYCWGGGGIVSDSTAEEEYQESIAKVRNLFDDLTLD